MGRGFKTDEISRNSVWGFNLTRPGGAHICTSVKKKIVPIYILPNRLMCSNCSGSFSDEKPENAHRDLVEQTASSFKVFLLNRN